jgi:Cu-Zn family superoxide dismutase
VRAFSVAAALALSGALAADSAIRWAKATLNSCTDGTFVGTLVLVERPSAEGVKLVDVALGATGLTPGKHAVHLHAVGNCTPCSAAGSHLDLGPFGHNTPVTDNHPYHSGDLINLNVGQSGAGLLKTTTSRIALSPDSPDRLPGRPLSIFDPDGASVIIHALPDIYCPDPADANCAGGARAACGILALQN